jgi:hypothetical protein
MQKLLLVLVACAFLSPFIASSQSLPYPILFVTQVPTPNDSATSASMFANHVADMPGAPRGGDLWIRYTDGSLKNLTQSAGYGVAGMQGAGAISVREPSVHWSGAKALFSMVVGGATKQGDTTQFYWQLYEITGLGKDETPTITKVPNQPVSFNNTSAIYGTDDRIILTSDRTRTGQRYLYPSFDEYKGAPTNTGLWSLDPGTGDLFQLDNSPSGDFSPTIDSYGRVLIMRWDRLQRDRNADIDVLGTGPAKGTFNYTDESSGGTPQYGVRAESFPEPQGSRTDLLNGTNLLGWEFNQFFPWQINEDGTSPEVLNHLGRHEMRQQFNRSINDDSNVVIFVSSTSGRSNTKPILNFTQVKEDPVTPGLYYGIDAFQSNTHSGGQIISVTAAPTLDPDQSVVTYVTDRSTQSAAPEGGTPNPNHSGFYRNPAKLSDGKLIAAHTSNRYADKNLGTRANPSSRFDYRLKTLKQSGNVWTADQPLTQGISKSVTYWDPDVQVSYNGALWELDPVEVRARTRPTRRYWNLPSQEQDIFTEEGVNQASFRRYLADSNLAVTVTRDVTHRDKLDHQQPFFLRIAGTTKQTPNSSGKVYDVSHMQFYQGDYIRGTGMTSPTSTPHAGRRILAVPMHLPAGINPDNQNGPAGSVKLGNDGSMAAFVPARRPVTWQLTSPSTTPIVRERYWVTFQPGEIRVCASCHGTNDAATSPINPIPQNKPDAFRDLLRSWKATMIPGHVSLTSPANDTMGTSVMGTLVWMPDAKATGYRVQLSAKADFATTIVDIDSLPATSLQYAGLSSDAIYYWRVQPKNTYMVGEWSEVWHFTTAGTATQAPAAPQLVSPANDSSDVPVSRSLWWDLSPGAIAYNVQLSTSADFASTIINRTGITETSTAFAGLAAATKHYWRVQGTNSAGPGAWSPTWSFTTLATSASVDVATAGEEVRLEQNIPDPFNATTTVRYFLPRSGHAAVALYDMRGAEVATLLDADVDAGEHWLLLDARERSLAGGSYLLRLRIANTMRQIIVHVSR